MSNYRRVFLNNHYCFLTILIQNRKLSLLTDHIDNLKAAFETSKNLFPYRIYAIVVLPDHFHMIICPENSKDYPLIISSIKMNFTNLLDDENKLKLRRELSVSKLNKKKVVFGTDDFMNTLSKTKEI